MTRQHVAGAGGLGGIQRMAACVAQLWGQGPEQQVVASGLGNRVQHCKAIQLASQRLA